MLTARRLFVVLFLLLLAAAFLLNQVLNVQPGRSLDDEVAALRWDFGKVPPGQEVVLMLSGLRNVSDEPLRITSIKPIGTSGDPGVAEVVSIELAPQRGGGTGIAQGPFVVYPPGESAGRARSDPCTFVPVVPAEGYELAPSEDDDDLAFLVTRFRALKEGDGAVRLARVEYEQDGRRYEQTIPLIGRFHVREDAKPMSPYRSRGCLDEAEVLSQGFE